jgi:hypothetical protein
LPRHGIGQEKQPNAAWKIYAAEPSNRPIAFDSSTRPLMASNRKIYKSENRTELSQTTAIAVFVEGLVERSRPRFIAAAGNGVLNSSLPQVSPDFLATVPFVSDHALRAQSGTSSACSFDGPMLHEGFKLRGFMSLSSRYRTGHQVPPPSARRCSFVPKPP